jgi:DNA-binding GntR family transcriptional regulator
MKLKEMIVNKELKPGELIIQNQLSQSLGVSRTPLRKALGELEKEGLLGVSPKGWFVKEFTLQDMISIFEIRAVLEGLACRLVVPKLKAADLAYMRAMFTEAYNLIDDHQAEAYYKADIKFHSMIFDATEDEILKRTLHTNQIIATSLMQGLYREPKETFVEHMAIIDMLEQQEGNKAEILMREHIQKAIINLKSGNIDIYR